MSQEYPPDTSLILRFPLHLHKWIPHHSQRERCFVRLDDYPSLVSPTDDWNLPREVTPEPPTLQGPPCIMIAFERIKRIRVGSDPELMNVILPCSAGISKWHFSLECVQNNQNLWLVRSQKPFATVVNGILLDDTTHKVRYLDPVKRNTIVAKGIEIQADIVDEMWSSPGLPYRLMERPQTTLIEGRPYARSLSSCSAMSSAASLASECSTATSSGWAAPHLCEEGRRSDYILLDRPTWSVYWSSTSYLAIHAPTGSVFATTQFPAADREKLYEFSLAHQALKHPHLVSIKNSVLDGGSRLLLIQTCPGNPRSVSKNSMFTADLAVATRQLFSTLWYLRCRNIWHGRITLNSVSSISGATAVAATRVPYQLNGLWLRYFDQQIVPAEHLEAAGLTASSAIEFRCRADFADLGKALISACDQRFKHNLPLVDVDDTHDAFDESEYRPGLLSKLSQPSKDRTKQSLHQRRCGDPLLSRFLTFVAYGGQGRCADFQRYLLDLCHERDPGLFSLMKQVREVELQASELPVEIGEIRKPAVRTRDVITIFEAHIQSYYYDDPTDWQTLAALHALNQTSETVSRYRISMFKHTVLNSILSSIRFPSLDDLPSKVPVEIHGNVPWLFGSNMVNITAKFGMYRLKMTLPLPEDTVEIYGQTRNAGLYVEYKQWLHDHLPRGVQEKMICPPMPSLPLEDDRGISSNPRTAGLPQSLPPPMSRVAVFKQYTKDKFVLIDTQLPWAGLVVMSRSDRTTLWEPFCTTQLSSGRSPEWLSMEQTFAMCDEFGLEHVKACMTSLIEQDRLRQVPTHYHKKKAPPDTAVPKASFWDKFDEKNEFLDENGHDTLEFRHIRRC